MLSVVTAIVASLAPARQTSRLALVDALRANTWVLVKVAFDIAAAGSSAAKIALTLRCSSRPVDAAEPRATTRTSNLGFDHGGLLTVEMPVAVHRHRTPLYQSPLRERCGAPCGDSRRRGQRGGAAAAALEHRRTDWPDQTDSQTTD